MAKDNLCKFLAETHPQDFAVWLLGEPLPNIEVLKTELGIEPIRADSVTFLRGTNRILHIEFQTEIASFPALPTRMLDYWIRLYRKYDSPITQIVILLKQTNAEISNVFEVEKTRHEFDIVKMWEQNAAPFLANQNLLPFAALAQTVDAVELLHEIADRIKTIENAAERSDLVSQTRIFAGLRFDADFIKLLLKENFMRESVIYQEILQEGRAEGIRQGISEGINKGISQGISQGIIRGKSDLLLHQLNRLFGTIGEPTRNQIIKLESEKLEELGVAMFDFKEPKDLQNWLDENETAQ